MPHSVEHGKERALSYIESHIPPTAAVLDVGPGSGIYGRQLRKRCYKDVDAVEVFPRYIDEFQLRDVYGEIFVEDIRTFAPRRPYHLMIFGDVLEHLAAEDAQATIQRLKASCAVMLFSLPWCFEQGAIDGNAHETHLQADLTPQIVKLRYPSMQQIYESELIGVYIMKGDL